MTHWSSFAMKHWITVFTLLFALVSPALAADLDGSKTAGVVGEQADGYVGLVAGNAPADVSKLVADVNQKRKAAYQEIAGKRGADLSAVAARAGAKLVAKAAPGEWVRGTDGKWVQK